MSDRADFLKAVRAYRRSPSKTTAVRIFNQFIERGGAGYIDLPPDIAAEITGTIGQYRIWLQQRDARYRGTGLFGRIQRSRTAAQFKAQPTTFDRAAFIVERVGEMQPVRPRAVQVGPGVRDEVLARLAASNIATISDAWISSRLHGDAKAAVERLQDRYRLEWPGALRAVEKCVRELQRSRLTVNFKAHSFFCHTVGQLGKAYKNHWELGAPDDRGENYNWGRDFTEQALFGYEAAASAGIGGATWSASAVAGDIRRYGSLESENFQPGIRPQYAALDFGECRFGGGSIWGRSFFVLRAYIVPRATFTPSDSMNPTGTLSNLANYHNMYKVVAVMPRSLLDGLILATAKSLGRINTFGNTFFDYVEAQLHSDFQFGRDVGRMYVSRAEINLRGADQDNLRRLREEEGLWPGKLRSRMEQFAAEHGIEYEYIEDLDAPLVNPPVAFEASPGPLLEAASRLASSGLAPND